MMLLKKYGTKSVAMQVAASMPPMTAVPMAWRLLAPAPALTARGTQPRMKASEVITMGRKRRREACMAATSRLRPSRQDSTANSTMRMAFLAARPTRVTRAT